MKIAILSDIHGNNYALEAVLNEARNEQIEKILVLGDIVGYYYNPEKVLQLLENWDHLLIQGNHERILADVLSGKLPESDIQKKYGSGHQLAIQKLDPIQLNKLLTAPEKLLVNEKQLKILMCHGSPWNADLYIYPNSDEEILSQCDDPEIDFIFIGHSHYQFKQKNKHSFLVNVGSVGQSRSKGGIANWAILDSENKEVKLMSTPYDVQPLINEIKNNDPAYLKDVLLR